LFLDTAHRHHYETYRLESANYFNLRHFSYRSSDNLQATEEEWNAKSILSIFKRSPLVCSFVSCYFIPAFLRPAFSAPPDRYRRNYNNKQGIFEHGELGQC